MPNLWQEKEVVYVIIWALFDSENSCYKQAVKKYFKDEIEIYAIGINREKNNLNEVLNLDLADYSELFGENQLFNALNQLPKPTVILASLPCESWSVASGMPKGNICWYTETIETATKTYQADNHFTIRTRQQLEDHLKQHPKKAKYFKPHWWKTVYNRVNGELCAYNTQRIIERYKPQIWMIENPQSSRIWRYYRQIQNFQGIENVAHYHAYDDNFPKKPTIFYSNVTLDLKTSNKRAKVVISAQKSEGRKIIRNYDERSNIPLLLIKDILEQCIKKFDEPDSVGGESET